MPSQGSGVQKHSKTKKKKNLRQVQAARAGRPHLHNYMQQANLNFNLTSIHKFKTQKQTLNINLLHPQEELKIEQITSEQKFELIPRSWPELCILELMAPPKQSS